MGSLHAPCPPDRDHIYALFCHLFHAQYLFVENRLLVVNADRNGTANLHCSVDPQIEIEDYQRNELSPDVLCGDNQSLCHEDWNNDHDLVLLHQNVVGEGWGSLQSMVRI